MDAKDVHNDVEVIFDCQVAWPCNFLLIVESE
jgi:hypothetical protein